MAVINNYGYTPVTITGVDRDTFNELYDDRFWDENFYYSLPASVYKGLVTTTAGDDKITFTADTFCFIDGIKTYAGNDTITIADGKTEGQVTLLSFTSDGMVNTGDGNDSIYIGKFHDLHGNGINTGNGDDVITLKSNSELYIWNSIDLGAGADKFIGGEFSEICIEDAVNTGSGSDTVSTAYGSTFFASAVNFGDGNDTLFIGAGSTFETSALNMGAGTDTLTVNGTLMIVHSDDPAGVFAGIENIKGDGTVIVTEDYYGNLSLDQATINRFLQAGIQVVNTVLPVNPEAPSSGAYDFVEASVSNNTLATADELSPVWDEDITIYLCGSNAASQHQYAFADSVDYYRFLKYGDDVEISISNNYGSSGSFADDFAGVTLSILNSQGKLVHTINDYYDDISELADGVYYLKAEANANTIAAIDVELEYPDEGDYDPVVDLQIANLYLSDYDPVSTESITARFTVCNMGLKAVQATTVGVYADGTKLGTVNVGALDVWSFQDCSFTIAANKLTAGAHTLEFKADDGNLIGEISENNTWRKSVTVQSPYDLCIQDYEVSSTSIAQTGSVKLTFKYANKGTSAAAASVLKVYDGNTLLRTFSMGSVAAGSYRDATVTLQGSELATGARKIYLVADANNQITESNEANNKSYRTVTVSSPVDLCIQNYEVSSTSINKTGSVKLSFKYANKGTSAAAASVLKVYDGNTLLRTFSMGSVEAGSYRNATVTLQGSELGTGARKIYLVVDANNQISESNEDNNKAYRTVTVESGSPDLCIQDYEVSSTSIDKNGSVKLSFKYANKGTAAAGSSVLKVYDGNTLLRTFTMGSVEAGSYRNATVTLQGSELAAGARKIFLVVDANGQIAESNEDNNKAYRTVTVESAPAETSVELLTAWQAPATDNALDLTGWQDNNPPCESVSLEAENIFSNGYLNTLPLNSAVSSLAGDITSENDSLLKKDQGMLA